MVRLLRLIRIFRILRGSRIFSRLESSISSPHSTMTLAKFIALVIVAVAAAAAAAAAVGWRRRSRVYAEAAPPAAAPAPVAPVPIQLVPTGAVTRSVLITRQDSAGNTVVQEQAATADSTGPAVLLPQGAILRTS